jgi:hypothetical protein
MAFQVFSRDGDATWGMRVGWFLDGRAFLCWSYQPASRLPRDFRDPMPEPSLLFSVLSCSGNRGSSSSSTSVIRGLNSYLEIYIDGLPQMEKYTDGHRWLFRFLAATSHTTGRDMGNEGGMGFRWEGIFMPEIAFCFQAVERFS